MKTLRRIAVPLAAVALVAVPASPAVADVGDAAAAFRAGDNVHVDPGTGVEESRLEQAVGSSNVFVAVVEPTGADAAMTELLAESELQTGTVFLYTDGKIRYDSSVYSPAELDRMVSAARAGGGDVTERLASVAEMAATGNVPAGSGSGIGGARPAGGFGLLPLLLLLGIPIALIAWSSNRRRRAAEQESAEEFAEVRAAAEEDVTELGERVAQLDFDVLTGRPEARGYYEQALASYERAKATLARAGHPQDLRGVTEALEEGRWAMAATIAAQEGRPIPERRPPCFFNPQHGPSVTDVEYAPGAGQPRMVPVCAADAEYVRQGYEPDVRQLTVHGQRVPYYEAGPAYSPYAMGYFGGYAGLVPGIFGGMLLANMMMPPMIFGGMGGWGGGYGGGDGGGFDLGGSFGGGDFGGGGFGGGDF